MNFAHVEGVCVEIKDALGTRLVRITVYLETKLGVEIVREIEAEPDPDRFQHGSPDLYWEADQWTQETIADVLIPRGWELIGAIDTPKRLPYELPRSPRYALRTDLWVPPPGWNEELANESDEGISSTPPKP